MQEERHTSDLLNRLTDDFESRLRVQHALTIEEFIAGQKLHISGELLASLLPVELEFRGRHQVAFTEDEFRQRFPQYASVVNAAVGHWKRQGGDPREQSIVPQVSPQLQETLIQSAPSAMDSLVNGSRIDDAMLQDGDVVTAGLSTLAIQYAHLSEFHAPETQPMGAHGLGSAITALLPREVGPYEITGVLGRGGMGVVYSALHRKTKEALAIKLVLPHLNTTTQALQIFLREASILTGLKHSRIVASREFGLHENRPYFVMEYVPSVDLEAILATQSPQRRIRIVCKTICKVLEGLQYAHEQGIVHRDIKPSNILVFWTGQKVNCKVADFGLAKRFDDAGMSGLTGENEIRGTLAYMPPEQLQDSRSAGPAADIYAAGVCLFRFLAGVLPYRQKEGEALLRCVIQHDVRPLGELLPDCPSTLEQIVTRAMQVRPGDRFESAAAMQKELAEFVNR